MTFEVGQEVKIKFNPYKAIIVRIVGDEIFLQWHNGKNLCGTVVKKEDLI